MRNNTETNTNIKIGGIVVKREEFPMYEERELVEKMVKKFIKLCNKEGIVQDCIHRNSYEKPSDKRRRKLKKSIVKRRQEENKKKVGG